MKKILASEIKEGMTVRFTDFLDESMKLTVSEVTVTPESVYCEKTDTMRDGVDIEGYDGNLGGALFATLYADEQVEVIEPRKKTGTFYDFLPEDGNFTEEELWEAIAEANGVDPSEIMDGDLAEWL
jgi:hypothetical protein